MRKIELLAPVGSYESFIAAINSGADAIYLAGEHFGAREKATFKNEEIVEMIKYAHIRNVRVHVVINTLIYDDEIDAVMKFVDFLYNNDVDAVIVQDLGIITLIHNQYPDLEIHASTQLNTLNYKQALVLKKLGVSRIIMAREADLKSIIEVIEKANIDVEVFAHGALCMGYSGQCLLSSFTMKKSGNRGECLQLCRLPYTLFSNEKKVECEGEYLLSCKDLSTLSHLDKLIKSGVVSLKIEGRVKSASYVGKVVSVYRKYIDQYYESGILNIDNKDIEDIKKVFNREFTKGYIFEEKSKDIVNQYRPNNIGAKIGKIAKVFKNRAVVDLFGDLHQGDGIRIVGKKDIGAFVNMLYHQNGLLIKQANAGERVSIDIKSEVNVGDIVYKTSDYLLNKEIEESNTKLYKRFPIDIYIEEHVGKTLKISVIDELENKVEVESEYIIDLANKTPTTHERIKEQVAKLNDSIYCIKKIEIKGEQKGIIPISIINHLRNEFIEKLNKKRERTHQRCGKKKLMLENIEVIKEDFSYLYLVNDKIQYDGIKDFISSDKIYFKDIECTYTYPRISNGLFNPKNDRVLINELNDIDDNKYMVANTYLNATNIYALYTLYKLGFKRVTLSLEMSYERIEAIVENYKKTFGCFPNIEVIVYGKIDLMITKHCPINKNLFSDDINCGKCEENNFYLKDRKGYKMDLIKDGLCNIRILNPKKLHLIDYCKMLKDIGVSKLRFEFTNENPFEIKEIIEGYNNGELKLFGATRGYFSELKED